MFAAVMIVAGYFIATGEKTRTSVSLIEPISNAGPAFAAVAIAFGNDPEILGATTGIIFIQIIVGSLVASYLGKGASDTEETESAAHTAARNRHYVWQAALDSECPDRPFRVDHEPCSLFLRGRVTQETRPPMLPPIRLPITTSPG